MALAVLNAAACYDHPALGLVDQSRYLIEGQLLACGQGLRAIGSGRGKSSKFVCADNTSRGRFNWTIPH